MATWEDGPEYAPLERPDAFAEPTVATIGLDAPPPSPKAAPEPSERPAFSDPAQPVPPLATLVPEPPAGRDPQQPFDVVSSVMTADTSAWASAHWTGRETSGPPGPTAGPVTTPVLLPPPGPNGSDPGRGVGNGQHPAAPPAFPVRAAVPTFPPPTGAPNFPPPADRPGFPPAPTSWQPGSTPPVTNQPGGQPFPPPGYPPGQGQFPAPGTPQWFAPGGYQQPAPQPTAPSARAVLAAATPGVLVTLVVGGFIWVLAPVTVVIAFLLSSRITYGRKATRTAFAAVLAFLGLVGLLSLVTADGLFTDWWDSVAGWACFGSWVMLAATVVAVYRALKLGKPDPPSTPRVSLR